MKQVTDTRFRFISSDMKAHLRNKTNGLYFQAMDQWCERIDQAFDFNFIERILRFVREAQLDVRQLELILAFDDPGLNITLPIDSRFGVIINEGNPPPRLFG